MHNKYDIIIVGGGIVGVSIAYHLATTTARSVCLIERHRLTSGTTWHAAGLVAELRASANLTRLARYSGELYQQLEASGEPVGYKRVGALTLATHAPRAYELQKQAAMARQNAVDCTWLSAGAVAERWPYLKTDDLVGAVYMPNDGQTNPVDTTLALARLARQAGADIFEDHQVTSLNHAAGRISGVTVAGELYRQTVAADQVVLAAGLWTRTLGKRAGANFPLYPAEHFYAVTEAVDGPLADLPNPQPIVRVPDHGVYLKPDAGRYLIGCFERDAKPLDPDSLPADFAFGELPFDLDHFAPYLDSALARIPQLENIGIRTWFNGPESFTPDGRYMLGPSPDVQGLWVAAGFNSIGIQSAGGVGQVMAHWLDQGYTPLDLWEVDVRRFHASQNQTGYLVERTAESLGRLYAMHWPYFEYTSARNQRRSPLHAMLADQGACFGELAGWERANWYGTPGSQPEYTYTYARPHWFDHVANEYAAVRHDVAVFDQTSFAKYQVAGPDACGFLNKLSTANLDVPVGQVVYCQWLNERAGIEADLTITRTTDTCFLIVSGAACAVRDLTWMRQHANGFPDLEITDVTAQYAVLGVMGPRAREVLGTLTNTPLGHVDFPFATSRNIQLGDMSVRATRISYVGALGWELYMPWPDASAILTLLLDQGATLAGYHAMDSLRLEKAYRHWGHDITDEDTPLEAGLSFTADMDKPDGFIGRQALQKQRASGVHKRLALLQLKDPAALLTHDEPVWRDNERVGSVTSSAYSPGLGCTLAMAYIHSTTGAPLSRADVLQGNYSVEIGLQRVPAQISLRALHDPDNHEIRC